MRDDSNALTVELKNQRPVDLVDLTRSFMAIAEAFSEYPGPILGEDAPPMRLLVREMRSGSIIADLVAVLEQADFIIQNAKMLGGFVANVNEVVGYFMGTRPPSVEPPSRREAEWIAEIVEPVAKMVERSSTSS